MRLSESSQTSDTCCVCRYTTCVPGCTIVSVDMQHMFVSTLDEAEDQCKQNNDPLVRGPSSGPVHGPPLRTTQRTDNKK